MMITYPYLTQSQLFASTRSVADTSAGKTLRHLFSDFPSKDSSVRLVMILIALFSSPSTSPSHSRSDRDTHNDKNSSPKQLHALFKSYKLTPLCKRDVQNVLLNPFVEQFWPMYKYAKTYVKEISEDSSLSLLREVVNKALVITCKGNLLADVLKDHPQDESTAGYESIIVSAVMTHYQLPMEGLPERDDPAEPFVAPLCRDVSLSLAAIDSGKSSHGNDNDEQETEVQPMDIDGMGEVETTENESLVSLPSQQNDASGLVCSSSCAISRAILITECFLVGPHHPGDIVVYDTTGRPNLDSTKALARYALYRFQFF